MAESTPIIVPSARYFYAVPDSGRLACPLCKQLIIWGRGPGKPDHRAWNPVSSVLTCPGCSVSFQLGILAWPITITDPVLRHKVPLGQRATI